MSDHWLTPLDTLGPARCPVAKATSEFRNDLSVAFDLDTQRVGETEHLTSQLFFEDALNNDIIATQPLYSDREAKDTINANDKVVKESSLVDYSFQTQCMDDGAMLAWKTLVVKA